MEQLLHNAFDCVRHLLLGKNRGCRKQFPHREVRRFLNQIEDVISYATSQSASEESEACVKTFRILKFLESAATINSRYREFEINLELLEYFFSKLVAQMEMFPSLQEENRILKEKLNKLLIDLQGITNESDQLTGEKILCSYTAYIDKTHNPYQVIVLDSKSDFPTEVRSLDGIPIIYSIFNKTDELELIDYKEVKFTQEMVTELKEAQRLLNEFHHSLFKSHSNLLSAQATYHNDKCIIKFIVPLKGCIPCVDNRELPKHIGRFKTKVFTGWIQWTGFVERDASKPVKYGTSVTPDGLNHFDDDPNTDILFGTIGGFIDIDSKQYGVTAGHLFRKIVPEKPTCMLKAGDRVFCGGAMAVLISLLRTFYKENEFELLRSRHNYHDSVSHVLKYNKWDNTTINKSQHIGWLVGAYWANFQCEGSPVDMTADVGVFQLNQEYIDPSPSSVRINASEDVTEFPNYILNENQMNNSFGFENEIHSKTVLIGQGANSEEASQLLMNFDNQKYVRNWHHNETLGAVSNENDPVYKCLVGKVLTSWKEGDSGTWFWKAHSEATMPPEPDYNPFIGMGIAKTDDGECILLPMKTVMHAAKNIISRSNNIIFKDNSDTVK